METGREVARIPIQLSRGVLVASVQVDLDAVVLAAFRDDLLGRIHAAGATGVILDLSGLDALDSHELDALRKVAKMARVMGARSILVGLKPGIVSALMMTDVDVDGLEATRDLDDAFRLLEPAPEAAPEPEDEADEDGKERAPSDAGATE